MKLNQLLNMTQELKSKVNNSKLHNAKLNPDDEFYTPYEVAKDLINPFVEQLRGKRIICPCDSPKSYIYIYLKELGMDVDYSTEMHAVNYNNYDIVITNPPFSKMQEFMRCIYGKKYIIIAFWLFITYKWYVQQFNKIEYLHYGSVVFINNPKPVRVCFYTNMERPKNWIKNKIEKQIIYSVDKIKSNDTNFAKLCLYENGNESFFRLIYYATNDWILHNITNLCSIEFNNYEKNFNKINAKNWIDDNEQMTIFDLMKGGE